MKTCAFCGSRDHDSKSCPWPKNTEDEPPPPPAPPEYDPYDGFLLVND